MSLLSLFTKKPRYAAVTIVDDWRGNLHAVFNLAAPGPGENPQITMSEYDIRGKLARIGVHSDDRTMLQHALAVFAKAKEDSNVRALLNQQEADNAVRTAYVAAAIKDHATLYVPKDRNENEAVRCYKGFTITDNPPEGPGIAFHLHAPYMHSADGKTYNRHTTHDMNEHRLLYEQRNCGHLNRADRAMVRDALVALRLYKLEKGLDVIPLTPQSQADRYNHTWGRNP